MENEQQQKYWFFGSKLNTALLLVLIVLMVVALKEMIKNQDYYKQNLGIKDKYQIPIGDTAYEKDNKNLYKTEVKTNYGISVSVPSGLEYSASVGDYGVFVGLKMIKILNGNHVVIDITKEPNQARFDEDSPRSPNDTVLVNSNYSIGGTTGMYYKSKPGTPDNGDFIVIPSKLVLISIAPVSFAGISQSELDKIVSSIIIQ